MSSLLDIGVPIDYMRTELLKLGIPGFSFDVEKARRSSIAASHLVMKWDTPREYRHTDQILALIRAAGYKDSVLARCEKVLATLGNAEAKVHGIPVEKVHFHEVGAVDTIIDIAGISLALEYLGVGEFFFSTLTDGRGTVSTRHGIMPVPVPAVAEMSVGFDFRVLDIEGELLTPTGCAVLTALGKQERSGIHGTVAAAGYGCGDRIIDTSPNVLRVFLVEKSSADFGDRVCVLESDMDHISGEIMGDVAARLMREGALDVSWLPVFMKKGRPGYRLTVLCAPDKQALLVDLVILHTRTLGVRVRTDGRVVAERSESVDTFRGESLEVKHCTYKGHSFTKPEYEALARISEKTGMPVIELFEEFLREK